MAYIELEQQTDGVPGWGLGVKRYFDHPDGATCDEALASFLAFSPDDQLASTTLYEPALPGGKKRQVVDCTGGGGGSTNDVTVDAEPSEWESYSGGGGSGGGGGNTPTATSTLMGHYQA